MSNELVYAVLHIPTSEYVTLKPRNYETVLCEDTVVANKVISIMIGDSKYYWGIPRYDFTLGKSSLKEYTTPPDIEEFDIIAIPKMILNTEALNHILEMPGKVCWSYV